MNKANTNWAHFKKHSKNPSWSPNQIFFKKRERFNQFLTLKNDFENENFEIFHKAVPTFGMIPLDTQVVSWTTLTKILEWFLQYMLHDAIAILTTPNCTQLFFTYKIKLHKDLGR